MKKNLQILIIAIVLTCSTAVAAPVPTAPKTNNEISKQNTQAQTIKENKENYEERKQTQDKKETSTPKEPNVIKEIKEIKETEKIENKPTQDKLDAYQEIRDQAKLLYNTNKPQEAQKLFLSIPDSEKVSDDWLIMANIAQDNNKEIDAVFYLKKAIQADDKNYKAHYNLGNIYYYDNKINMALIEYRKVLRIQKDYPYAYYNKGCCYLKKKSWFNAKYEFGLAIKANPEEPSFYYNLAYTYKMLKKPKKAQEALEMYNKLMSQ